MLAPRKYKFLSDFKKGPDGKYVYTGAVYSLTSDYKKANLIISVFGILIALCVIGSGFVNAGGMNNSFYVIVPYVLEVICLFVVAWNTVRIVYAGKKVRAYIYEPAHDRIPDGAVALSVFSAAALTGSAVFTVLHGFEGKMLLCIVFWLLKVLTVCLGIAFYRCFKKLEWEKL